MISDGWRTIIINNHAKVSYSNNNMIIETETAKDSIPVPQIKTVLINTGEVSLTARLICELNAYNIKVIFCDTRHLPCCETTGHHNYSGAPGKIRSQISWNDNIKEQVWTKIIKQKILSQYNVLKNNGIDTAATLKEYADNVTFENAVVMEAHAARVYFISLFGKDFNRRSASIINSALNYGYSIILSDISRCISLHGYLTEIGIYHSSYNNPFNFSCDIMEPFRQHIDNFVYNNIPDELSSEYKKKLVGICLNQVIYNNRKMDLQTAMDMYVTDVLHELSTGTEQIKELKLYEQI